METIKYKDWYIHINFMEDRVQVQSPDYELFTVKSVHAAKCFISRRISARESLL